MKVARLLGLAAVMLVCSGAEAPLDVLRGVLVPMRKQEVGVGMRGATPQLTVVKHLLRDWVESRLAKFGPDADERELEIQLNRELRSAGLFCGEREKPACPDWTSMGYVEPMKLARQGMFLVLQTGVGIECGWDESAYVFSWSDEGWRRVWEAERNTYTEKEYKPQILHGVLISGSNAKNDYVVLTLGSNPWCSSVWQTVYYRAFRLGPNPPAKPLVEGEALADISANPVITGTVSTTDVEVGYTVIVRAAMRVPAVRHFRIDGEKARRIDPFALCPRDFVDEWIQAEWREAAMWSEGAHRVVSRDQHVKLHKEPLAGRFIYPTMHCPAQPDIWQVGLYVNGSEVYFLVRWTPPYRFRMVNVSDRPWPACSKEDGRADEERPPLFPIKW